MVYEWTTIDQRNALIVDLYRKGLGSQKIADALKIAKRTAYRILRDLNVIDKNRSTAKFSKSDLLSLQAAYDSGIPVQQLATTHNVDVQTIYNNLSIKRTAGESLSIIPADKRQWIINTYTIDKKSTYHIAASLGIHHNVIQNFIRKSGLSIGCYNEAWKARVQSSLKSTASRLEKAVATILEEAGLKPDSTQFVIDDFRYDFSFNQGEVLVECQGSYWHSSAQRRQRDAFKRRLAHKHGKRLVVIWDYQIANKSFVINKVKNALKKTEFDFSNCEIIKLDWNNAKALLVQYHYQRAGRAGIAYGIKHNGHTIACCVFANCQRLESAKRLGISHEDVMELSRFVINPEFQAYNMATWFISRCIKLVKSDLPNLKYLISFADPTFGHTGTIYKASNWTFDGETKSSYWYYHRRMNKIYHKKTIWDQAKKLEMTEDNFYKAKHLLKVHGQPKLRYVYCYNS
jgi:very-short-patch-repair endonuclease/transposase-like protein